MTASIRITLLVHINVYIWFTDVYLWFTDVYLWFWPNVEISLISTFTNVDIWVCVEIWKNSAGRSHFQIGMLVSALGSRSKGRQIKSRYLRAQFCDFTAFTYLTLLTEFLVNHNFTESWPYDQPRLIERKSILALVEVQDSPLTLFKTEWPASLNSHDISETP